MGHKYFVDYSDGAMRTRRKWEAEEGVVPPRGGGGSNAGQPGPSTAGRVSLRWSERSRRNMRWDFAALPWHMLGPRPAMVTLTYPGDWRKWCPDSQTMTKQRNALYSRWLRRFGQPYGVWVVEFQPRLRQPLAYRRAPHVHLYVGLPNEVPDWEYGALQVRAMRRKQLERQLGSYRARNRVGAVSGTFSKWLRLQWAEVVTGNSDPDHYVRGVDITVNFFSEAAAQRANRTKVADYFWRESGKWAQKEPPDEFGPLAYYGRWGGRSGFAPVVTTAEVEDERVKAELQRVMRRARLDQLRKHARWLERVKGVPYREPRPVQSRGRDGMTVVGIGRNDVPGLLVWARDVVAWKEDHDLRSRPGPRGRARWERREERRRDAAIEALITEREGRAYGF